MSERIILIAGPSGAGKSTAIATLFGETAAGAVDFGELELAPGEVVRVYASPPGKRYDFMWQILGRRAVGVLLLIRHADPAPVDELLDLVDGFASHPERGGLLVAVTHAESVAVDVPGQYQAALAQRFPDVVVPVLTLDPRDRDQLVTALSVLAASVDGRAMFGD